MSISTAFVMVKHIQTIRPLLSTNCLSEFEHNENYGYIDIIQARFLGDGMKELAIPLSSLIISFYVTGLFLYPLKT